MLEMERQTAAGRAINSRVICASSGEPILRNNRRRT